MNRRSGFSCVAALARFAAVVILGLGLAACSGKAPVRESGPPPDYYTVKRGDTLSAIAFRYGLDYRELARMNRLASADRIYVGQQLRLQGASSASSARAVAGSGTAKTAKPATAPPAVAGKAPVAAPVASNIPWQWPAKGTVSRRFNPSVIGGNGILIEGRQQQRVSAASAGEVVYSGDGIPNYGRLIIVKHDENWLSAYGYLGRIYVKEGDSVGRGEAIAELGSGSEDDPTPALHFEIRKDGQPVDPLHYLSGDRKSVV